MPVQIERRLDGAVPELGLDELRALPLVNQEARVGNAGQVVGEWADSPASNVGGFLWTAKGAFH